ncbi:cyclic nucleotide-binding domain-containing protein [Extensimonas perlucida]|jgi:CRP-like cAMP-binding protein|uniref:cyclic nucleotide-binding domain-containing protein n=1 Tax=Extensimonas perlucida TaxID=2590786 RepID=UPI00119ED6C4|nr:cyclic nucleotide-binding domain-containing protein [Extensimonas perlucida]MBC7214704.1 cyclic nucleotide-binding domain-containing protein [Burkholderiaceae bacterium]
MSSLAHPAARIDLSGLVAAVAQAPDDESLNNPLSPAQWDLLGTYLQPLTIPSGHVLFAQGSADRTLYFIESGNLSVHYQDEKERLRIALVGPGSVVGEGAFFAHRPRSATVQSTAASKLWALAALRFAELANRQPAIALGVAMAAGAVMAKRLGNRRRRVAVT